MLARECLLLAPDASIREDLVLIAPDLKGSDVHGT
jgi:hypothetical protein